VGSISEKVFIKIGGVKQGMFIKSKDVKNPVLLYLHGGIAILSQIVFSIPVKSVIHLRNSSIHR
jgi:hypothetical protein